MTAKVVRLDDHVLDADILTNEVGAWFAHDHEHGHPPAYEDSPLHRHTHRHDHRRRSKRGDWDHHPPATHASREPAGSVP